MNWGKDHGEEMVAVGGDVLRKVKGNQKINAGHNFLKGSMEAWVELARRRRAWGEESGSTELLRESRTILQAAQVGRNRLPGHLRATMDAE
eukprot:14367770-Alexandrium_andersonii.AAC.1